MKWAVNQLENKMQKLLVVTKYLETIPSTRWSLTIILPCHMCSVYYLEWCQKVYDVAFLQFKIIKILFNFNVIAVEIMNFK